MGRIAKYLCCVLSKATSLTCGDVNFQMLRRHVRRGLKAGTGRGLSTWEISRKQGFQAQSQSVVS